MESLYDKTTPKALKVALQTVEGQSDNASTGTRDQLDSAFDTVMERIKGQKLDGSAEIAERCLSWIVCAKRPLTAREVQIALAVEFDESEFDEENITSLEEIVSACNGLVMHDKESDILRLVHYTLQDFLERKKVRWLPNADIELLKTCLKYMSYNNV